MKPKKSIAVSEYLVDQAPGVLVTYGIGSCLAIALYDPKLRIGGLAHTLLPKPLHGADESRPGKFVETAIRQMMAELGRRGADRHRLTSKLAGGAAMFGALQPNSDQGIGSRNIQVAREVLRGLEVPVAAEDVGGNHGRTVELDLVTGKLKVRSVRGSDKLIIF